MQAGKRFGSYKSSNFSLRLSHRAQPVYSWALASFPRLLFPLCAMIVKQGAERPNSACQLPAGTCCSATANHVPRCLAPDLLQTIIPSAQCSRGCSLRQSTGLRPGTTTVTSQGQSHGAHTGPAGHRAETRDHDSNIPTQQTPVFPTHTGMGPKLCTYCEHGWR